MAKSNKWLYMIGVCGLVLNGLALAVPVGATVSSAQQASVVKADVAGNLIEDDTPLTLTLHKYQSTGDETVPNTGDLQTVTGHAPLANVRFTVTKVTPVSGGKIGDMKPTDTTTFTKVAGSDQTGTTDATGAVTFDLGTYKADKGVYLVHEEVTSGVTPIKDFFVQLPLAKASGTGFLTDVNVYPKNDLDQTDMNPIKTFDNQTNENPIQVGKSVSWDLSIDVPDKAYIAPVTGTDATSGETVVKVPEQFAKAVYILDPVSKHLTADLAKVPATLADGTKLTQGTDYTVEKDTASTLTDYTTVKISLTQAGMKKAHGQKVTFVLTTSVDSYDVKDGVAQPIVNIFNSHYTPATGPDVPQTTDPDGGKPTDPDTPTTPTDPKDPDNPDKPTVLFGRIDLTKVAEEDESKTLDGAVFKIAASEADAKAGKFIKAVVDDGDQKAGEDLTLTTGADGTASINGLANGQTYYLVETKAPKYYDLSDQIYAVTAAPDITTDETVKDQKDIVQEYLPLTGGQLRLVLMATGTTLILAFGTALYIKKRKEA